jgi:hypothetical protein
MTWRTIWSGSTSVPIRRPLLTQHEPHSAFLCSGVGRGREIGRYGRERSASFFRPARSFSTGARNTTLLDMLRRRADWGGGPTNRAAGGFERISPRKANNRRGQPCGSAVHRICCIRTQRAVRRRREAGEASPSYKSMPLKLTSILILTVEARSRSDG